MFVTLYIGQPPLPMLKAPPWIKTHGNLSPALVPCGRQIFRNKRLLAHDRGRERAHSRKTVDILRRVVCRIILWDTSVSQ